MRKYAIVALATLAALALPAAATAIKPTKTEKTNAAKECKLERGTTDASRAAFAEKYGTNKNKKNAFGKCVAAKGGDGDGGSEGGSAS